MMNSSAEARKTHGTNINGKLHTFSFKIQNSDITISRTIEYFDSPETQDIIEWIKRFRYLADSCKWRKDEMVMIIPAIIDTQLHEIFIKKHNSKTMLDALLAHFYPEHESSKYEYLLQRSRQINFVFIEEYDSYIEDLLIKFSVCRNSTPDQNKNKHEDVFINGLSRETRIDMAKQGLKTYDSIKRRIIEIERSIKITNSFSKKMLQKNLLIRIK
ncbi:hypothetical protein DMUE_1641 [Dictyocoela muelleri]|nr:hypothetical protein DMUE_1641 [Dictyocoela muelleri]